MRWQSSDLITTLERQMRAPLRKSGPAKVCYDCDHELYPNGKIIFDDVLAG